MEPLLHEDRDADQHPLSRSLGRDIDPEVIGIANERVAAPFQLVVEVVEHDVGQKRR